MLLFHFTSTEEKEFQQTVLECDGGGVGGVGSAV